MKSHKLSIICDLNSSMNIEENCQLFMISKKKNVLKKKKIVLARILILSESFLKIINGRVNPWSVEPGGVSKGRLVIAPPPSSLSPQCKYLFMV